MHSDVKYQQQLLKVALACSSVGTLALPHLHWHDGLLANAKDLVPLAFCLTRKLACMAC